MTEQADQVSAYWAEGGRLAGAARVEVALYLAALTGISALFNFGVVDEEFYVLMSIADVIMVYVLLSGLIRKSGLVEGASFGGFGRYFGVSFLSGLAIILGLVLLIVPGIVLMVRWMPAMGFALAGDKPIAEAFSTSWKRTEGHTLTLLGVLIVPLAMTWGVLLLYVAQTLLLGMGEGSLFGSIDQEASAWVLMATDFITTLGSMITTVLGIAAYSLLRDRSEEILQVFE